jgi:hypothetical protein
MLPEAMQSETMTFGSTATVCSTAGGGAVVLDARPAALATVAPCSDETSAIEIKRCFTFIL